jgi:alkanesulfonate monooxygenase SsuD/methylene tetrahydromethanopterin reductase-like flavin-dependent oxidoreductase (luciferase family)
MMEYDNRSSNGKQRLHSREKLLSFARKAESLGYDSLSVNDHVVAERTIWLDSLNALSAAAAVTNRIKLGTSVLNIVVRNPVICAKSLSAIDILSSGRLFAAGVGPGSQRGDYDACGIPFEQRWGRFNEALEIWHMLWSDIGGEDKKNSISSPSPTRIDYNGKYYQLKKISIEPRPFQKPHPPIQIGTWGSSEAGLKRAAKYGDGWMASAYHITPDKFKKKWKTLLSYRQKLGKDIQSFDNSVMSLFGYIDNDRIKVHRMAKDVLSPALGAPAEKLENSLLFGSTDQCLNKIRAFSEAGVKRIHFWPISDYLEQIETFRNEIARHF